MAPCYAYFIPQGPQLPDTGGTSGSITFVDPYAKQNPQNAMYFNWWCKGTSSYTASGKGGLNFQSSTNGTQTAAWSCAAGGSGVWVMAAA